MCSDWKAGSSLGSSQTADKLRWLKKPYWVALTAGRQNAIESLIRVYRRELATLSEITDVSAEQTFERIAKEQLVKAKSDCVERELGVTYEYFRTHPREFPPHIQAEIFTAVRKTNLGASLLVVGFFQPIRGSREPLICVVRPDASVSIAPDFGTIGEGYLVATPPLLRRDFDSTVSLRKALYQVYEAKTLAEIVNSVGEDTSLDVFYPDGSLKSVTKLGYDCLDRRLREYGPKRKISITRWKESYLQPFPFSEMS